MELKRITIYEEGEKKNKIIMLKAKEYDFYGDMALIIDNFKRFMKNEKKRKGRTRRRKKEKKHNLFQHATIV